MSDLLDDFFQDSPRPVREPRQRPAEARSQRPAETSRPPRRPTPDSEGPRRPQAQARPQAPRRPRPVAPSYTFSDFLRDERTHLGFGITLCLVAVLAAVFTLSFLFNGAADQSVIHGRSLSEIANSGEELMGWGGAFGAKIASFLLVDTFGLASFILVYYMMVLGCACIGLCKCKFFTLTFRTLFSTAALSIIIGLLTYNSATLFHYGGKHGHYVNEFVMKYADALGAYGLSAILAGLLFAIYLFPIRRFFKALGSHAPKRKPHPIPEPEDVIETEDISTFDNEENQIDTAQDLMTVVEPEEDIVEEAPAATVPDDHSRFMPPAALDDFGKEEPKPQTPPKKTSGPELVIVNNAIDAAADAPAPIKNGDHIGLDQPYDARAEHSRYEFPSLELLIDRPKSFVIDEAEQAANKELIVNALRSYNIEITRIEATIGPTVTLYEIVPEQGTRIAKIKSLEDDIAMSLSALGIRIIAPIPGKGTIGIEVPNSKPQVVSMRTVLESRKFRDSKMRLPLALGATISNDIYVADLTKMPHLLVAGATGQGKSVGLNCIITSLLYCKHPDELKFVLIDPKMVEFSLYSVIDKQYLAKLPEEPAAVITDPQKVIATLNSLCVEMDQRYELLKAARVRTFEEYNERYAARMLSPTPETPHRYLPYIVMIVDEYADLVMTAGKDVSVPICRIAQKARAVGMHMIIATQRPSTDVITGMIKANFPARIAFKTTQSVDSKTILDRPGAQRLIGRGDMLTMLNGTVERVQCAFVDTPEVEAICQHIASQPGFVECYELPEPPLEEGGETASAGDFAITDEFRRCALFISTQDNASITSLQRKFEIGFNKAGRYMDQMEQLGIVGKANGAKPRQVLMGPEEVERLLV